MTTKYSYSKVIGVIENLFPDDKHDNFFLIKNATESDVRDKIYKELSDAGNVAMLDLYVMVMQIDHDVMIKI